MISKVSAMHSAKMETACRKMAESYVDYEMTGRNLGMCEHLDKEHFYCLTRGYFEAAVRNGSLYCAGDNRKDISSLKRRKQKGPFMAACFRQNGRCAPSA